MSIKRYTPKYKKLNRLRQAFWREKGAKIKRFKKQKLGQSICKSSL